MKQHQKLNCAFRSRDEQTSIQHIIQHTAVSIPRLNLAFNEFHSALFILDFSYWNDSHLAFFHHPLTSQALVNEKIRYNKAVWLFYRWIRSLWTVDCCTRVVLIVSCGWHGSNVSGWVGYGELMIFADTIRKNHLYMFPTHLNSIVSTTALKFTD